MCVTVTTAEGRGARVGAFVLPPRSPGSTQPACYFVPSWHLALGRKGQKRSYGIRKDRAAWGGGGGAKSPCGCGRVLPPHQALQ